MMHVLFLFSAFTLVFSIQSRLAPIQEIVFLSSKPPNGIVETPKAKYSSKKNNKISKALINGQVSQAQVPEEFLVKLTVTPPVVSDAEVAGASSNDSWGKAKQISEHTWTMNVGQDEKMASSREVFDALNKYRQVKGKSTLGWDQSLADYSQVRAEKFSNDKKLDEHAGFSAYFTEDKMREMGLRGVGENSSIGYVLGGTHLIEWVFAGDAPHDDNQLNSSWNVVGVGISGNAVNLIFATK
ncbi:CAP domain-containing protein [Patescibacteria group bacterium]|nr:CAP domain-containing protein [Patescibacteria group bacterium]